MPRKPKTTELVFVHRTFGAGEIVAKSYAAGSGRPLLHVQFADGSTRVLLADDPAYFAPGTRQKELDAAFAAAPEYAAKRKAEPPSETDVGEDGEMAA